MVNRNPVKQVFITLPHSHIDKHTLRDFLLQFNPEFYKVSEEHHKDGTPHLHAVVKFKNKYSCTHIVKKFKDEYPNEYKRFDVKPVRSIKHSIRYISKEDPDPLTNGPFVESRNPNRNNLESVAHSFGHSSYADMLLDIREARQKLEDMVQLIWKRENSRPFTGYLENFMPFEIQRIRKKVLQFDENIYISKDDMTKIFNFYYNLL